MKRSSPRPPLPFVFINMAMSADGKIATASRAVSSFGSPRDQAHLYALRATADAVLCGARTVEGEGADLGSGAARFRRERRRRGLAEHAVRVVASGSGSLDPEARIFRERSSPIVILVTRRASARRVRRLQAVADAVGVFGETEIAWGEALRWLASRWPVRRLLCEGGGELNASLLRGGWVQELHVTLCPYLFGGRRAPTLAEGPAGDRLAEAVPCRLKSCRRLGNELFLVYAVGAPGAGDSARRAMSQSRSENRLRKTRISGLSS